MVGWFWVLFVELLWLLCGFDCWFLVWFCGGLFALLLDVCLRYCIVVGLGWFVGLGWIGCGFELGVWWFGCLDYLGLVGFGFGQVGFECVVFVGQWFVVGVLGWCFGLVLGFCLDG